MTQKGIMLIGNEAHIDFPELKLEGVLARIDTGAKTAAIWASNIVEKDNKLHFTLFDKGCEHYTGEILTVKNFSERVIVNSFGIQQTRYTTKFLVQIGGRKIRATFTLADRSLMTYPVLIGRNVLRGKFIVDVKMGAKLDRKQAYVVELKELSEQKKEIS